MMEKIITCTVCPQGCRMTVTGEELHVSGVTGNKCPRGAEYAQSEFVCPVRTATSSVRVEGGVRPLVSVRSSRPIPAARMAELVELLRGIRLEAPVAMQQVVFENLWNSGVGVVTTAEVAKRRSPQTTGC